MVFQVFKDIATFVSNNSIPIRMICIDVSSSLVAFFQSAERPDGKFKLDFRMNS